MSRCILFFLFCLLLTAAPLTASSASSQSETDAVASSLSIYYPQVKYKQINPTPVTGIYEIVVDNNEIIYFAPASGHMIVGEIWTADARNLTRDSKNRLLSEKLSMFPLDKAIKIGNGPNQVVEVTDPDCPYCRQGSAFFSMREDITRYIFLYPLDKIHPEAEAKSRYILSSADPAAAYEEVFSGAYDDKPLPEFTDNGLLREHRRIVDSVGVNGTPRYWINGEHIAGFNPQQIEKMLDK